MAVSPEEWMNQADYDIETAEFMHQGGRHFYAVFMCHLATEKALKGIYWRKMAQLPPKSHNLPSLVRAIGCTPTVEMLDFLIKLNEAQIFSRYPDSMAKAITDFPPAVTDDILKKSKEVLTWIKSQW